MTESLKGQSIIAGKHVAGAGGKVHGHNPATGEILETGYTLIDDSQLKNATTAAAEAYASYSSLDPLTHASFLQTIAGNIEKVGEQITERVMGETGLPEARANGERGRTVNQLRLFAKVVRQGDFRGVRWDQ